MYRYRYRDILGGGKGWASEKVFGAENGYSAPLSVRIGDRALTPSLSRAQQVPTI